MNRPFLVLKEIFLRARRRYRSLAGTLELDSRITVGLHSYGIGEKTVFLFREDDRVEIGRYCSIAFGVSIFASGEHNFRAVANYPFHARFTGDAMRDTYSKGPVRIGNDVWIGANATILSGVTIGDGAVIAAGAVVVTDVAPYSIVAGVPARLVKYRFEPRVIERLLEIRWWDWPPEFVREHADSFYTDVEEFIENPPDPMACGNEA